MPATPGSTCAPTRAPPSSQLPGDCSATAARRPSRPVRSPGCQAAGPDHLPDLRRQGRPAGRGGRAGDGDLRRRQGGRAAAEDGDPVEDLRAAWRAHIDFGLSNPDLFVLLTAPGRVLRSRATVSVPRCWPPGSARLADAGLLRVTAARAVSMIHAAGSGVVLALVGEPAPGRDAGLAEAALRSRPRRHPASPHRYHPPTSRR